MKKEILLIGEKAGEESYHPAGQVLPLISQALPPQYACRIVQGTGWEAELPRCDVLINYLDCFSPQGLTSGQAQGFIQWVEEGGSMILLHNGVCIANHPDVFPWLGYRFWNHPAQEELHFQLQAGHPITKDVGSFTLKDEPYHYRFHTGLTQFQVVAAYTYSKEREPLPAVWYRQYGKGYVANLCMGHTVEQVGDPHVLKLLCNSVDWLCGQA